MCCASDDDWRLRNCDACGLNEVFLVARESSRRLTDRELCIMVSIAAVSLAYLWSKRLRLALASCCNQSRRLNLGLGALSLLSHCAKYEPHLPTFLSSTFSPPAASLLGQGHTCESLRSPDPPLSVLALIEVARLQDELRHPARSFDPDPSEGRLALVN